MSGGMIGPEYDGQIRQTIVAVRSMGRTSSEMDLSAQQKATSRFPSHAVILDAALASATHSLTGATSALATVCRWNIETEDYAETDLQILVWNHSESTGFSVDTFGEARMINGHYWFFGDCQAMNAR
jgi:hypothetical protein